MIDNIKKMINFTFTNATNIRGATNEAIYWSGYIDALRDHHLVSKNEHDLIEALIEEKLRFHVLLLEKY
jgi:hypothetical protein